MGRPKIVELRAVRSIRERLVGSALLNFHEHGFNGTSVEDIAKGAGIPKGSLYNHFASKEALGAEIVDRYDQANVFVSELEDGSAPPLSRIRGYFVCFAEVVTRTEAPHGCLLGNFTAEMSEQSEVVRARLHKTWMRWTAAMTTAVRAGQADGTIPGDLPADVLAKTLLDAFQGAILRMRAEKSGAPFDHFMDVAFGKILR